VCATTPAMTGIVRDCTTHSEHRGLNARLKARGHRRQAPAWRSQVAAISARCAVPLTGVGAGNRTYLLTGYEQSGERERKRGVVGFICFTGSMG